MPIRPLDMQVMLPKMQEVARMRQNENQKSGINQNNIATTTKNETKLSQKTVTSSGKDQEADNNADAKEEGKNKYGYKPTKKKKEDNNPPIDGSYHKIDVKI
jgi:hypothetical protein